MLERHLTLGDLDRWSIKGSAANPQHYLLPTIPNLVISTMILMNELAS
jgi:hypothetical protein